MAKAKNFKTSNKKIEKRKNKMTTQEIYQEIHGLIKLLKKEGKGAYLRKTLCEKMYDTVSSDLEILEEVDTDLEHFGTVSR